jgi:hypothetical protein
MICPHCAKKMPDRFIVCTSCHKELAPQVKSSDRQPTRNASEPPAGPAFRNGNRLGLWKWIQIFVGALVCLVVFLGPLIQSGNVQNSSLEPLAGTIGQVGHLFSAGEPVILVAKSKGDLLALRAVSSAPKQNAQEAVKSPKKAGSRRSSRRGAPVPAGSTVRVLNVSEGLCRVIVLDGEFEGTLGWVDSARISSLSRQEGQ